MGLTLESTEPAREGGFLPGHDDRRRGACRGPAHRLRRVLELVPNWRIVETHNWVGEPDPPETRVTITLEDVPDGTRVTTLHEGLPGRESAEDAEAALPQMRPVVERLLEPMMAEPPELLGQGPVVLTDLTDLLEAR